MGKVPALAPALIKDLRRLDSATVANAVETFDARLPNTGFADSRIRCLFPDFPPMVGYAATARIRTAEPPMEGQNYIERRDWLNYILTIPEPRVVVLEDMDDPPGLSSLIGEMHANILNTLGCAGVVTNGAVRGLPTSRAQGVIAHGIATRPSATRSTEARILGCVPVGFAMGHDFWSQRSGAGRYDK
jgi:4-hydroxy-4-methyl-2-oxoglutarate aldolase